eukprot:Nk52_evm4s232 gene=Nk52_evmTU4s232
MNSSALDSLECGEGERCQGVESSHWGPKFEQRREAVSEDVEKQRLELCFGDLFSHLDEEKVVSTSNASFGIWDPNMRKCIVKEYKNAMISKMGKLQKTTLFLDSFETLFLVETGRLFVARMEYKDVYLSLEEAFVEILKDQEGLFSPEAYSVFATLKKYGFHVNTVNRKLTRSLVNFEVRKPNSKYFRSKPMKPESIVIVNTVDSPPPGEFELKEIACTYSKCHILYAIVDIDMNVNFFKCSSELRVP